MKVWSAFPFLFLFFTAYGAVDSPSVLVPMNDARAGIDRWILLARKIAAEPVIVTSVAAQNARLPEQYADMTQAKWAALAERDPLVVALSENSAARLLLANKIPGISEMFISDQKGRKVAFLSKTTNWSHEGKLKHEKPMEGQTWEGRTEYDQSAGLLQMQFAVPIVQNGRPIGSLVVGVEIQAPTSN